MLNIEKGMAPVIKTMLPYKVFRWNTIRIKLLATYKMFLPEHEASKYLNKEEGVDVNAGNLFFNVMHLSSRKSYHPLIMVQTEAGHQTRT